MTTHFIAQKQIWKIPSEPHHLGKVGRELVFPMLVRKRKTTQTFTLFQAFMSNYEQSEKDLRLWFTSNDPEQFTFMIVWQKKRTNLE